MKLYIWRYQSTDIAIAASDLSEAKEKLLEHLEERTGHLCISLASTIFKYWGLTVYEVPTQVGLVRDVTFAKSYPELGFTLA